MEEERIVVTIENIPDDDDGNGIVDDSHSGEQDSEGGGYVDHLVVHSDPLQTAFDP